MRRDPFGNPLHIRMHYKHSAYWYVYQGKWRRLGSNYASAMQGYSALIAPASGMQRLIEDTYASYELMVKKGDMAPGSLAQYNTVRGKIDTAFREFSPSQVKAEHIGRFLDFHFEGAPSTGNSALTVLRTAFDKAVRWGMCEYNPAKGVDRFKERKRKRYLTDAEWLGIRAHSPEWLRLIIDMCYLTAQRIGDVLAIKQSDITAEGILFTQQKTGKRILVESTPELDDVVRSARALSKVAGVYLFSRSASKPASYTTTNRYWHKARKAAGVEDARIHDLRAKAITDADAEGLDAQKLAGHAARSMTERYLRLMRTDKVQSPAKLQNLRQSIDAGK